MRWQSSPMETETRSLQFSAQVGVGYSRTVTVNEQVDVLPLASVQRNTLVVVPIGYTWPDERPLS